MIQTFPGFNPDLTESLPLPLYYNSVENVIEPLTNPKQAKYMFQETKYH